MSTNPIFITSVLSGASKAKLRVVKINIKQICTIIGEDANTTTIHMTGGQHLVVAQCASEILEKIITVIEEH